MNYSTIYIKIIVNVTVETGLTGSFRGQASADCRGMVGSAMVASWGHRTVISIII